MKIYFAGAIRAGRENAERFKQIIECLKQYGEVLTEHIASVSIDGEPISMIDVHDRDLKYILASECIVAEVSTPSTGVGYEIGRGLENGKKVLCLYYTKADKKVSGMVEGCRDICLSHYNSINEANKAIDVFMAEILNN